MLSDVRVRICAGERTDRAAIQCAYAAPWERACTPARAQLCVSLPKSSQSTMGPTAKRPGCAAFAPESTSQRSCSEVIRSTLQAKSRDIGSASPGPVLHWRTCRCGLDDQESDNSDDGESEKLHSGLRTGGGWGPMPGSAAGGAMPCAEQCDMSRQSRPPACDGQDSKGRTALGGRLRGVGGVLPSGSMSFSAGTDGVTKITTGAC